MAPCRRRLCVSSGDAPRCHPAQVPRKCRVSAKCRNVHAIPSTSSKARRSAASIHRARIARIRHWRGPHEWRHDATGRCNAVQRAARHHNFVCHHPLPLFFILVTFDWRVSANIPMRCAIQIHVLFYSELVAVGKVSASSRRATPRSAAPRHDAMRDATPRHRCGTTPDWRQKRRIWRPLRRLAVKK